MKEFTIEITEYNPAGRHYPEYKNRRTVIAESVGQAKGKAMRRTPWINSYGSGWQRRVEVVPIENTRIGM